MERHFGGGEGRGSYRSSEGGLFGGGGGGGGLFVRVVRNEVGERFIQGSRKIVRGTFGKKKK